jgi:hypothetical protein
MELATLGGHRMDNFGLGLQPGVPTLETASIGGAKLGLFRLRSGCLRQSTSNVTPVN